MNRGDGSLNRVEINAQVNQLDDQEDFEPVVQNSSNINNPRRKIDSNAHIVKRMVIQNQQRMRKQRFRFDTIDTAFVFKSDIAMILIQFVVSIIYLGSWLTFIMVRVPRLIWGCAMTTQKLRIFRSNKGVCMMKADYIVRLVTLAFYICLSFGFSIWLPEQFCLLIGKDDASFSSCKWQVFGFRLVFILLYLPVELVTLAVVYRNATDMIFKI